MRSKFLSCYGATLRDYIFTEPHTESMQNISDLAVEAIAVIVRGNSLR